MADLDASRGRSSMTLEELRAYCEQTGQPVPFVAPRRKGPHAKVALDLGGVLITVECPPDERVKWRGWLRRIQEKHGGDVVG